MTHRDSTLLGYAIAFQTRSELYQEDRIHGSLDKDTPNRRPVEPKPASGRIIAMPRLGGLHHRYAWQAA